MLGWLAGKARLADFTQAADCTPERPYGTHGVLVGGRGGMDDAICCLRCGREKYEEQWTREEVARQVPLTDELLPALERTRRLPAGIHRDEAAEAYAAPGPGRR